MTRGLPLITGAELPSLGWHSREPFDRTRINPVTMGERKPTGGLWACPMYKTWTIWTRFAYRVGVGSPESPITTIHPDPDAAVYRINRFTDLTDLIEAYPLIDHPDPILDEVWKLRRRHGLPDDGAPIDWAAAARHIDAVWLTASGQAETRYTEPNLMGWDVETVFFLQPRLQPGDVVTPDDYKPRLMTEAEILAEFTARAAEYKLTFTEDEMNTMVKFARGMGMET